MQLSKYANIARRCANRASIASCMTFKPTTTISANISTPYLIRKFGADHGTHGGKPEPFLDEKLVTQRIIEVIKNFEKVNAAKVTGDARFKEDLDLDSLDAVEVVMAIEEEFAIEIPDSEADKILSVKDAVAFIANHPAAK